MRRCLAIVLPSVIVFASIGRAQDVPSHEIDDTLTPPKNISKLLDPKKLKGKGARCDVEMMKNLLKFMDGVDPNNVDPEMVKQFLRDNPEFNNKENLDKLRELAEQQKRVPANPNDPRKVDWNGVQERLK